MSLSSLSIAVMGTGYGSLHMAMEGFADLPEVISSTIENAHGGGGWGTISTLDQKKKRIKIFATLKEVNGKRNFSFEGTKDILFDDSGQINVKISFIDIKQEKNEILILVNMIGDKHE